jgi:hypothetical protein
MPSRFEPFTPTDLDVGRATSMGLTFSALRPAARDQQTDRR